MNAKRFWLLVGLYIVVVIVIGLITRPADAQEGCTIRTDWPIYTVARGDTLYRIARRFNTTTAILASSNCLTNSNRIYIGQPLRVPSGGVVNPPPTGQGRSVPTTYQKY